MTFCAAVRPLIQERLDRALTESERRTLDGHLADCPDCRAYQAELAAVDAGLAAMPAAKAPAALFAGLDFAAAAPARPRRRFQPSWALSTAAGVLVLVGLWQMRPATFHRPVSSPASGVVAVESGADPLLGMFDQEPAAGSAILEAIDLPAEE